MAPKSSGGVSKAALVGATIGTLILLVAISLFAWWYRRRFLRQQASSVEGGSKEAPARAEDVLNRPDPNEKPEGVEQNTLPVYPALSNSTLNLDSSTRQIIGRAIGSPSQSPRDSVQCNPFADAQSIQTTSTSTQGTNVIPIALVAPGSVPSTRSSPSAQPSSPQLNPTRPGRTPDLDLNLDHLNVSGESTGAATPHSQASGAGSELSNRHSYLSGMSYASDFLNEAPMIVTPTRGTVRQVLGVVKAEVIQTPPSPSSSENSLKPPTAIRPAARSPLAGSSFGPADVLKEVDEDQESSIRQDPFDDVHSAYADSPQHSPALPTSSTQPSNASIISDWSPDSPSLPWTNNSRPSSLSTQAGSIIADIGSATRVQVGLSPNLPVDTPTTADSSRNLHRMTSARLVSPVTQGRTVGTLEQQQQKALLVARQDNNRVSSGSVLSTTSTKADSILESFHFVPPSPISDRPVRVAPRSPLAEPQSADDRSSEPSSPLPSPPDRRTLGMSTGSQISTLSAGLGAFPFQMDSLSRDSSVRTPDTVIGPQRASLDTLALTSDLSSYPLGFDMEPKDKHPLRKM